MPSINEISTWFVAEVKERTTELDLRPYHLVRLCKIKEDRIESHLRGDTFPGLFSLVLMAEHLECTVNDLLGFEEIEEIDIYERYLASDMFFTESQYATCLSDRVRRYLEERNMTLAGLAKQTEFRLETVRHWFSKTRPHLPPTVKFLKICEILECTPSELLGY